MADFIYAVMHDELTKTLYTLRYFADRNTVRLVEYYEMHRESTRKKVWTVDRWYDWHNHRDRRDPKFKPISEIILPQEIKQRFMQELIESLTFITTEERI